MNRSLAAKKAWETIRKRKAGLVAKPKKKKKGLGHPLPPKKWWQMKEKQGLSPAAIGRIWHYAYDDKKRAEMIRLYG